jgi:DNA polymerase III subunit delta
MQLKPDQLVTALNKQLAPIYLIHGDEPLQAGEAADQIRLAARKAGFNSREVFEADAGFDWQQLLAEAGSLSIFTDKKIIDLRLPSGKPGTEGGKAIQQYCQHLPDDTILLISSGKIAKSSQNSRWFQVLEKVAVILPVYPLQGIDLINWLQRRSQNKGMQIEQDALRLLASRIEGNLLAAAQELEKLYILHGHTPVSRQILEDEVADSARFDVFILLDTLLNARANRAIKILHGLRAEGVVAPVVLWALSKEIRLLYQIKNEIQKGTRIGEAFTLHKVWGDKRKQSFSQAIKRLSIADLEAMLLLCAKADWQIKGQAKGDSWESLFTVCMRFCALPAKVETA